MGYLGRTDHILLSEPFNFIQISNVSESRLDRGGVRFDHGADGGDVDDSAFFGSEEGQEGFTHLE